MPLTVGGGVRTIEDIRDLLLPALTRSPSIPRRLRGVPRQGSSGKVRDQCVVVAIDAKKVSRPDEPDRWAVFTHGGRNPTGLDALDYAREVVALGAGEIL